MTRWRFLFVQWLKRDLAGRYRGSWLGMLWPLAQPMAQIAVFTLIFHGFMKVQWPVGQSAGVTGAVAAGVANAAAGPAAGAMSGAWSLRPERVRRPCGVQLLCRGARPSPRGRAVTA